MPKIKINGRKSGRPKLDDRQIRKQRAFRASDEEWEAWHTKAAAYGYTNVYAWIRAVLEVVDSNPDATPENPNEAA